MARRRSVEPAPLPSLGADRLVDVDGHRVHFVEAGAGEPLLLIPGAFTNHRTFGHIMPALAERFRVLAIDYLGTGQSVARPGFDYSPPAQAAVVAGLMYALGIERARFIGASYGGAIALNLAAMYPERVERVVVIEGITHFDEARWGAAVEPLLRALPLGAAMTLLLRSPLWGHVASRAVMGGDWSRLAPEARQALRAQIRRAAAEVQPDMLHGLAMAMATGRGEPSADIRAPVLQILGERSPFRRHIRPTNDFLLTHAADVRFATIAGGGHALEVQQPEAVLRLALPFLLGDGSVGAEDG